MTPTINNIPNPSATLPAGQDYTLTTDKYSIDYRTTLPNGFVYTYAFDTDGVRFCFSAVHPDGWDMFFAEDMKFSIQTPDVDTLLSFTSEQFIRFRALLNSAELESAFTAAREWLAGEPTSA